MKTVVQVIRRKGAAIFVKYSENALKEIEELRKLVELDGKKEEDV